MNIHPPSERQARTIWIGLTSLAVTAIVLLLVALVWGVAQFLNVLSPVLWPLAVAAILACLLDPLVDWFERKGLSRMRSIFYVFGLGFLILAAVFGSVVPQIISETRDLVKSSGLEQWLKNPTVQVSGRRGIEGENKLGASTNQTIVTTNIVTSSVTNRNVTNTPSLRRAPRQNSPVGAIRGWLVGTNNISMFNRAFDQKTVQSIKSWLVQTFPEIGRWLFNQVIRVASWFGVLVGLALIPVYTFYFLLEKIRIEKRWRDYLPVRNSQFKQELIFILDSIQQYLVAFFRGQVLVAICDSVLYTIGFLCLGLNYAFLLGFAGLVLLIIPFLGAIVLCLGALTLTIVQYGDWLHPVLVLALFAVVQTLESVFISPKIMGDRVGLHPLVIIVAVMAGTTLLGGLLGGILAIPLAAALRVILSHYIWKKVSDVSP